jgi:hypothetical protein
MQDCNPTDTVLPESANHLVRGTGTPPKDLPYLSLLGSLLWIARFSRPDILHAVTFMAKFNTSYTAEHYTALQHILRYLKKTKTYRYVMNTSGYDPKKLVLTGYSDSDWASDKEDRKSTTGGGIFLNGCLIDSICKRQTAVSLSSTEAETYAASVVTSNLLFLVNLLKEISPGVLKFPVDLKVDNEGCRMLLDSDTNSKRAKHIDIRVYFIRDWVRKSVLRLIHVPTDYNFADLFTKILPGPRQRFLALYVLGMQRDAPEALL